MNPITKFLDEVEQRLGKATPGPWVDSKYGVITAGPMIEYTRGSSQSQIAMVMNAEWMLSGQRDENAQLIAHAPEYLKTLLAIVKEQSNALKSIASAHHEKHAEKQFWLELGLDQCATTLACDTMIARTCIADCDRIAKGDEK